MSSETDTNPAQGLPLEFDAPEAASPAKKTAKKAAKKAAKKVTKKAAKKVAREEAEEGAREQAPAAVSPTPAPVSSPTPTPTPTPAPASRAPRGDDFRPTDFKGRGSHFDGVERIEVVEAPEFEPDDLPTKADRDAREEGSSSERSPEEGDDRSEQRQGDDRQQHRHQRNKPHQNRHQRNDQRNDQRGKPHPNQQQKGGKGKPHQGHPGQQGYPGGHSPHPGHPHPHKGKGGKEGGKGNRPSGWQQPPPPFQRDDVEGDLPKAERFAKFDEIEVLLQALNLESPIAVTDLYELKLDQMAAAARELGVEFPDKPGRKQVIEGVFKLARETKKAILDRGFLDLSDDGFGFIVHPSSNYQLKPESTYVPATLIKKYALQRGHELEVVASAPEEGERCPAALKIVSAMGQAPEEMEKVTPFEDLIPYYPTERLVLETPMPSNSKKDVSMRAFDLLTPIGFGQRGLIVAPPRTGKTVLLQGLANSIQENYPDVHLIVLLIDERPEEVTDFRRGVKGEVISSTFDETATSHVHAAEMVCEKARRMVEQGKKVVILLDSITRLARAYNTLSSNSGKIMSGGIEATALQRPKRFFGSARNIEGGGSLTIMGTALVETGSKMDEVIFEEFKGTGNMELHLDRDLINKRIFPAINFERSGTRKEELLYHVQELEKVYSLRRVMQGVPAVESMEMLIKRLKVTKNNIEFLMSLK